MISDQELRRRIFHLIGGIVLVGLISQDIVDHKIALVLLVIAIAFGLILKKVKVPIIHWFFRQLDRPKDFKKLPGKGSIFYLIGAFLALFLFPKDIAMASIMIMALGDSVAAIAGQYGMIKSPLNEKKFIEGSIAGILVAFVGAMFFVSPLEAGVASVASMIAEGVTLKKGFNPLDDNIIMPIVAGVIISLLRFIL